MDEKTLTRFFSKVNFNGPNGCWIWLASTFPNGYGAFRLNGSMRRAHRISYEYFKGQIPEGLMVRHRVCHNPSCINPIHLDLGTNQDNMDDMVREGRQNQGENHGMSKLTRNDVEVIRHLFDTGQMTRKELALAFPVSEEQIDNIIKRSSWKLGGNE